MMHILMMAVSIEKAQHKDVCSINKGKSIDAIRFGLHSSSEKRQLRIAQSNDIRDTLPVETIEQYIESGSDLSLDDWYIFKYIE